MYFVVFWVRINIYFCVIYNSFLKVRLFIYFFFIIRIKDIGLVSELFYKKKVI